MIVIIVSLAFLIFAIALHELGHIIILSYLRDRYICVKFKIKPLCFEVGETEDYKDLSRLQLAAVYVGGIAAGLAALIIAFVVLPPLHSALIGLLYLGGCSSDIKNTILL